MGKRRSKDRIAAYLKSAGVERFEETSTVTLKKDVPLSLRSESAVEKKAATVAILDAKISAADEELNSVIKSLRGKRKRASSADNEFHGWAAAPTLPRTGYSLRVNSCSWRWSCRPLSRWTSRKPRSPEWTR